MRTKTFRTSDAERLLLRAGVTRVNQSDGFCLGGVGARAISATLSLNKHFEDKYEIRGIINFVLCVSLCEKITVQVRIPLLFAVCQYFCRPSEYK